LLLPNDMRISCRPSCPLPHKPTLHSACRASAARMEAGAPPACRLHARVRHHSGKSLTVLHRFFEKLPHRAHHRRGLIQEYVVPAIKLDNPAVRYPATKVLAHGVFAS
jgi:hypothetical protein